MTVYGYSRRMRRRELLQATAALAASSVLPSRAQDASTWPSKPVRLVLPFSPGGSTDFQGRLLCEWLGRHFGQQFVIDYKPGAGSNLGVAELARSAPDGYTLGWITVASHAINPTLYARMPFDPGTDPVVEKSAGQVHVRFIRAGHVPASVGRDVRDHDRHGHAARALQG